MIDLSSIESVVQQYSRFGWHLRRILLSNGNYKNLENTLTSRFAEVSVRPAEIDALWFSRANPNSQTWELRRLSGSPFALVQVIDAQTPAAEREEVLQALEIQIAASTNEPSREIPLEK
jgi:hypothetical protein